MAYQLPRGHSAPKSYLAELGEHARFVNLFKNMIDSLEHDPVTGCCTTVDAAEDRYLNVSLFAAPFIPDPARAPTAPIEILRDEKKLLASSCPTAETIDWHLIPPGGSAPPGRSSSSASKEDRDEKKVAGVAVRSGSFYFGTQTIHWNLVSKGDNHVRSAHLAADKLRDATVASPRDSTIIRMWLPEKLPSSHKDLATANNETTSAAAAAGGGS